MFLLVCLNFLIINPIFSQIEKELNPPEYIKTISFTTNNENYLKEARLLRSWGRSSSAFKESENIENRFNVYLENVQYDTKFIF